MSEFHVNVVKLGPMVSHPNADTLNITKVFDYPVITKKDGFKEGDLVVYIPVDSIVPDTEEWHWLCPLDSDGNPRFTVGQVPEKYRVIEAKKLRGIFSQGMLAPVPFMRNDLAGDPSKWTKEGDDVREAMGITKYEPPVPSSMNGECEAAPKGWVFPVYTDIEGIKRYPNVLIPGEIVVVTEKIHGCNSRFCHDGTRLWVGSHTQIKKRDDKNLWWQVALANDLEEKLAKAPMHVFFGETYGQVQDLKYGIKSGSRFRVFDVYDVAAMKYLDYSDAFLLVRDVGLDWVPVLGISPWDPERINPMSEGKTTVTENVGDIATIQLADNVREGFVVRPIKERWSDEIGRVILKRVGEDYLLRKKKK